MIALSAVCTAFASVCVAVGNMVPMLDYTMFLCGSLFVMVPILAGSYKGGMLCAVASILIGIMIAPNFIVIVPYVVFFAPYAVILCFCEDEMRNINIALKSIIKLGYFVVVELIMWKYANFFADFDSLGLSMWLLFILGLVVLFVFDFLMKRIRLQIKYQLWRLFKIGNK